MSSSNEENESIVARLQNPVVDAWNDTESEAGAALSEPAGRLQMGIPRSPKATVRRKPDGPAPTVSRIVATAQPGVASPWVPLLWVVAAFTLVSASADFADTFASNRFGSVNLRFAAVGASARLLMKPVFSAVIITMILVTSEQRNLSRLFLVLLAISSLALFAIVPFFVLDALQVRPALPSRFAGQSFVLNVGFAVLMFIASALVCAACVWSLRKGLARAKQDSEPVPASWQG